MLMKKVTVVAALLLFLPFVVNAKDGNPCRARWKPNETPETPESDLTASPYVFNVTEAKKTVRLTLNLAAPDGYTLFMTQLHQRLEKTTGPWGSRWIIEGSPVLGTQMLGEQPDTWICVDLWGLHGETSTLAIRADNLYLVGFMTNSGSWYAFKNKLRFISESQPLPFSDGYPSITGGVGYKYLSNVAVGKRYAQRATSTLAWYGPSTSKRNIREALLTFILMICEAQRFTYINDTVTKAWERGGKVPDVGVELVIRWRNISCALINWDSYSKRDKTLENWKKIPQAQVIQELGDPKMTNAKAAAQNVNFILSATRCEK